MLVEPPEIDALELVLLAKPIRKINHLLDDKEIVLGLHAKTWKLQLHSYNLPCGSQSCFVNLCQTCCSYSLLIKLTKDILNLALKVILVDYLDLLVW